jgi:hypothetical protein
MKLRISPSTLESYRNYLNGNYELWGKNQADLKAELLGGFTGNAATSLGTVVHAFIEGELQYHIAETGNALLKDKELDNTWQFSEQSLQVLQQIRKDYEEAAHELPLRHIVTLPDGTQVEMNMRIDALEGLTVTDFKTSKSPKKWGDYSDSLQWRCYCMALPEVNLVQYVVLEFKHNDPEKLHTDVKVKTFDYLPEQDNDQRVMTYLNSFVDWVKSDPELLEHFIQHEGEDKDAHITKMVFTFPELVQKVYSGLETKENVQRIIDHNVKKYPELSQWAESIREELREFK